MAGGYWWRGFATKNEAKLNQTMVNFGEGFWYRCLDVIDNTHEKQTKYTPKPCSGVATCWDHPSAKVSKTNLYRAARANKEGGTVFTWKYLGAGEVVREQDECLCENQFEGQCMGPRGLEISGL